MNINEIKEKISELTKEGDYIRLPFSLMVSAVESTKRESNMDVHELDFSTIFFYRVINGIKAILEHLEIEFDYPLLENGEIDAYATYDQFIEIYDILEFNALWRYNELLNAEVDLAEKERIQIGTTEGRMVSIMEKLAKNINDFSDVINDDKKLEKKLKIVKKHIPQLGSVFGEIGKYLPRLTDMLERRTGGVDKDKVEEGINEVGTEK